MKKETFTREEVITVIDDILQSPDILIDVVDNANTHWHGEKLLELAESRVNFISVNNFVTRSFHLTEKEEKEYRESGAKQITFIEGGGIGTKVVITNAAGGVKDITDYERW